MKTCCNQITTIELHQQLMQIDLEHDLRTIQRQMKMLTEHFDTERDSRRKFEANLNHGC